MREFTDCLARVARYWDSIADRYLHLFRHEFENKPYDLEVLKAFASGLDSGSYVCDAGCGPCAHVTRILSDYGLKVVGIDISPRCVLLAQQEQPRLKFEIMNMANMVFADGQLDGLVAYYALHYQPKSTLHSIVREFARVLRPGGRVLIVAKQGKGESWISDPMGSGEEIFWSALGPDELQSLFSKNGFVAVNCTVREPLPDEIPVPRIYLTAERVCSRASSEKRL